MITREVREWLEKAKRGQYSYDDAMYTLQGFAPYLTREELVMIKSKLKESYHK